MSRTEDIETEEDQKSVGETTMFMAFLKEVSLVDGIHIIRCRKYITQIQGKSSSAWLDVRH